MQRFWETFLRPIAVGSEARALCEIGSLRGGLTRKLLHYCLEHDAVVHVIDPLPQYDVDEWKSRYGDALIFHRALSLDALAHIPPPDMAFVDGDHNWYTVINELRLLERKAEGARLPVVAFHDVGWPYGRRDLYYDPGNLPREGLHPHEAGGLRPGESGLTPDGINVGFVHATYEGGPRNGVLTAIEDFMVESDAEWELRIVPGGHGLGVLAPSTRLAEETKLARAFFALEAPAPLRAHLELVEAARISEWIGRARAERQASEAARANGGAVGADAPSAPPRGAAGASSGLERSIEGLRAELARQREELRRLERAIERNGRRDPARGASSSSRRGDDGSDRTMSRLDPSVRRHVEELRLARRELDRAAESRAWRLARRGGLLLRRLRGSQAKENTGLERAAERVDEVLDGLLDQGSRSTGGSGGPPRARGD